MSQLSSTFKRGTSGTHAMTLTPTSNPRRRFQDDSAATMLRPSILVIEDDPSVTQMLLSALESWGYEVFLAKNGREGLHVLTTKVVNGILLDMNMPVMSGETMLDALWRLGYPMPVVIMTGGVKGSDLRQPVNEGAQGFMSKPFSLSFLRDVCATIFENQAVDGCARIG